jgi:hypothetical protein
MARNIPVHVGEGEISQLASDRSLHMHQQLEKKIGQIFVHDRTVNCT